MKTTKKLAAALLSSLLLSGAAMAQAAERTDDGHALGMKIEGNEFVLRGKAGDQCGILIGMQELDDVRLPGGARLNLQPLAILAHGRFDETGEYRYDWSQWGFERLPQALAQGLSYSAESNTFQTSNMLRTGNPDVAEKSQDETDRQADTKADDGTVKPVDPDANDDGTVKARHPDIKPAIDL